jgi:Matrixin
MTAFIFSLLISPHAQAFLLVHPQYRLKDPENVSVNIASGGCQGNGVSNDELKAAITRSIERYWNTVAESRLKMKTGDEVAATLAGGAEPGEVLVGCQALGIGGSAGVTNPNIAEGSATIALNSDQFTPGNYTAEGMIGVLSHELGHAVGLNHSGDPASVMTYESHDWGPSAKYLAQDDKDGVVYLYGNEANLGGFLGGCSAIAADRPQAPVSPWAYFAELLLIFAGVQLVRLFNPGKQKARYFDFHSRNGSRSAILRLRDFRFVSSEMFAAKNYVRRQFILERAVGVRRPRKIAMAHVRGRQSK